MIKDKTDKDRAKDLKMKEKETILEEKVELHKLWINSWEKIKLIVNMSSKGFITLQLLLMK